MICRAKSFERLRGLRDFSDRLLKNHVGLYQGYVKNTNHLAALLLNLVKFGKTGTMEYAEMKRRFGWEFNGLRLHEYYFENLTPTPTALNTRSRLHRKIEEDFGRYDLWEQGFKGTGGMRGVGCVILAFDAQTGRLFNVWLGEHDTGLLIGTQPLLVMDMFEHAFLLDYGLKRNEYEEAFFNAIDWEKVGNRLVVCVKDEPEVVGEEAAARV